MKKSQGRLIEYGYAPGEYFNRCRHCQQTMDKVDKLATSCERCAMSRALDTLEAEVARLREGVVHVATEELLAVADALIVDLIRQRGKSDENPKTSALVGQYSYARRKRSEAYSSAPISCPQAGEDVVERAAIIFFEKMRELIGPNEANWSDEGEAADEGRTVIRAGIRALFGAGILEGWNSDWSNTPKDKQLFLVKYPDGRVTTAYYYWYIESEEYGFNRIEMWALQDANLDMPIDDNGPPEDQGLMWRPML